MARRAIAVVVLALCLGAPVVELFDRWDPVDREGNDSELALLVAAACVGMALTAATTALLMAPQANTFAGSFLFRVPRLLIVTPRQSRILGSSGSPPKNLRV